MKLNDKYQTYGAPTATFGHACRATCQKLLERIDRAKAVILSEFRDRLGQREHLLDLALNEAEALAWQTGFPQLVFPTLAMEKAQAAASWHARQRALRRRDFQLTTGA
jgi:hypothetical protein